MTPEPLMPPWAQGSGAEPGVIYDGPLTHAPGADGGDDRDA